MIVSFRDGWLREFFVEDVRSKRIPSDLESRLFRKIQMIDDATTDQDLRVPPSNHFEKLRGNLEGFHSIRVNKQWRLIFQWDGGRGEATGDSYLELAVPGLVSHAVPPRPSEHVVFRRPTAAPAPRHNRPVLGRTRSASLRSRSGPRRR